MQESRSVTKRNRSVSSCCILRFLQSFCTKENQTKKQSKKETLTLTRKRLLLSGDTSNTKLQVLSNIEFAAKRSDIIPYVLFCFVFCCDFFFRQHHRFSFSYRFSATSSALARTKATQTLILCRKKTESRLFIYFSSSSRFASANAKLFSQSSTQRTEQ